MQPVTQDIVIYEGDFFDFFFRLRQRVYDAASDSLVPGPYIDLTGWTFKSQIRASPSASTAIDFDAAISDQVVTPGGVYLSLAAAVTANLAAALNNNAGVWDVQGTNPAGEPRTYIRGAVALTPQVTKP